MSHISKAHQGLKAVENRQWDEAIALLTEALAVSKSPLWLLARAQALQQTGRLAQALHDSELAYVAAQSRQEARTVKNMADAQYRRAVILFRLGRLADADACCVWSQRLCEDRSAREMPDPVLAELVGPDGEYRATAADARAQKPPADSSTNATLKAAMSGGGKLASDWTRAYIWRSTVLTAMDKLPPGDPARKLTVTRAPQVSLDGPVDIEDGSKSPQKNPAGAPAPSEPPVKQEKKKGGPVQKLKVDFYQTNEQVTLSIFVKDTDKNKLQVTVNVGSIELHNVHREDPAVTTAMLIPEHPVQPQIIRQAVTPRKIELTLKKGSLGQKWGNWGKEVLPEESARSASSTSATVSPAAPQSTAAQTAPAHVEDNQQQKTTSVAPPATTAAAAPADHPPAYPTSSRHGTKDWERLAADEDEDDKAAAEGSDVDFFFKQLYKNATPEQQRAMMKSYTESNGTALSTNWDEVKDHRVDTHPPDGVEAKKW